MKQTLQQRRKQILTEMAKITRMRQGQLSSHYVTKTDEDDNMTRYGPYHIWQSWRDEKQKDGSTKVRKQSVRVSGNINEIQEEVDAYRKFKELAKEFMDVTEEITLSVESKE